MEKRQNRTHAVLLIVQCVNGNWFTCYVIPRIFYWKYIILWEFLGFWRFFNFLGLMFLILEFIEFILILKSNFNTNGQIFS